MQQIRVIGPQDVALVGWGVRVMLVTPDAADGPVARRLAGLGGQVECHGELFTGLSQLIDDPFGYALLVIDCDAFGGLDAVRMVCAKRGESAERVPVILISEACSSQSFPADRRAPILLRRPVSAVSLRVGFEHALRDRLVL